jgi:hypothetical protein
MDQDPILDDNIGNQMENLNRAIEDFLKNGDQYTKPTEIEMSDITIKQIGTQLNTWINSDSFPCNNGVIKQGTFTKPFDIEELLDHYQKSLPTEESSPQDVFFIDITDRTGVNGNLQDYVIVIIPIDHLIKYHIYKTNPI